MSKLRSEEFGADVAWERDPRKLRINRIMSAVHEHTNNCGGTIAGDISECGRQLVVELDAERAEEREACKTIATDKMTLHAKYTWEDRGTPGEREHGAACRTAREIAQAIYARGDEKA